MINNLYKYLAIKNIIKNHGLARSIVDANLIKFISMSKYKVLWYRKSAIKIDRFYPSSKIYEWNYVNTDLELSDRIYGMRVLRDDHLHGLLAANNILKEDHRNSSDIMDAGSKIAKPMKHLGFYYHGLNKIHNYNL